MCPKICTSSLQLGVALSTKRLKTCQVPIRTIAAKTAATNSSMQRSIAANSAFMFLPKPAAAPNGTAALLLMRSTSAKVPAATPPHLAGRQLLLGQDLLQQVLGFELGRHL